MGIMQSTTELVKGRKGSQRVLVTGGSGFVGTNLISSFLGDGLIVLSLDKHRPVNSKHVGIWRSTDILRQPELKKEFAEFKPTWVVHLAAETSLGSGRKL